MKIFLIGYRCSGKTTIGKILAQDLNFDFIDTDQMIEQKAGLSVTQIVEQHGWSRFRLLEKKTVLSIKNFKKAVIATGGGVVTDPDNIKIIRNNGFSIWLYTDIKTILKRLKSDAKTALSRPSLIDNNTLLEETKELLNLRNPLYKKSSHLKIDTTDNNPEKIANIIHRSLKDVGQYPGKSI